jgi:ABC-2 type transport system permease protein
VFGIPFHVVALARFVVAVPATILGLGLLGFVFASTFVLYRNANALSNMLEWPVLLVTGMLVPLSLCPAGRGRSRGCSPRPGACRRSARRQWAAPLARHRA